MSNNSTEQKVYISKAQNPDSWDTDMSELEYLEMFIINDLWHLTEVENV